MKQPKSSMIIGIIFTIASLGLQSANAASETRAVIQSERPEVEVVFVLDTTGSMGGLIDAAKEKIWSIANTLVSADPAPKIRMGLVGYRDRGDTYVTTFTPLSDDLDKIYSKLMQFQADGGGDTPESVNQALHEAVTRTVWSDKSSTYRVIFLVGDAPPQMGYQNDIKYAKSCLKAVKQNIVINTIQCGNYHETTPFWREIAQMTDGEYFSVSQSGSAVLYKTPYDKQIADLSRKLDDTRLYYGSTEHIQKMESRKETAKTIYSSADAPAVARRTIFNSKAAGKANFLGSQELVNDVETGGVDLGTLEKEQLPAELRIMDQKTLKTHISNLSKNRKALQQQIDELAKKRQSYIQEKVSLEKDKGASSLDAKLYKCIKTQAAKKDIDYKKGPAY